QPCAAGVPQADHRSALSEGLIVGRHDRRAPSAAHRAALNLGVAGERHRQHPVDLPGRGHGATVIVRGEHRHGARVEQRIQARLRVAGEGLRLGGLLAGRGGGGLRARGGRALDYGHRSLLAVTGRGGQAAVKARQTLCPPKPNELFSAAIGAPPCGLRFLGSVAMSTPASSSGSSRLMVGGATASRRARMVATASSAPAPPSRCPVIGLVGDNTTPAAAGPSAATIAWPSTASPAGVEVACALTWTT